MFEKRENSNKYNFFQKGSVAKMLRYLNDILKSHKNKGQ